jgi:tetratricopeptide (TPR) repeat protein
MPGLEHQKINLILARGETCFKQRLDKKVGKKLLDEASAHYEEALGIAQQEKYPDGICQAYMGIGKCQQAKGMLDEAQKSYLFAYKASPLSYNKLVKQSNWQKGEWNVQIIANLKYKSKYKLNEGTEILVSPAEKRILDFCKDKLPKDVVNAYFDLGNIEEIITILKININSGVPPHWNLTPELTTKYAEPSVHNWFKSDASAKLGKLMGDLDEEYKGEENQINGYDTASSIYKDYLETRIKNEIDNINDIKTLNELYGVLVKMNSELGSISAIPKEDTEISWLKNKIFSALLNQYGNNIVLDTEIDKKLEPLWPENKLIIDLKKYKVINESIQILRNTDNKYQTNDQIVDSFHHHLEKNKSILTKSRGSGSLTFAKALGVAAATIFGLGIGGYFAHKSLFGSTREHKFIDEVSDINMRYRPK